MEKLKLSEIRKILEDMSAQEPAPEETIGEFSQRIWEQLPRIPYKDLPASLQKQVRERFTPDTMRRFLRECYDPLPKLTRQAAPQNAADLEANTGVSVDELLSFDGMTSDIPADDVDKLLIHARNMATYTIEIEGYSEVEDEDGTKRTIMNIVPMLYGNYAIEAFEAVLEKRSAPKQAAQIVKVPSTSIERTPVLPMPTSPLTYLFARVVNAGGEPTRSRTNRHERIECLYSAEQNAAQYTRRNKGQEQTVTIYDPEKTLKGGGKIIGKMFFYMLQRWEAGGYGRQFTFPLQELVDLEIYSSIDAARRGVKTFMGRQALIQLSQQINVTNKEGKRQKENVGGVVFYHHVISNNEVTVYVNDKMPFSLLAKFFTMFPSFAYGLSTNAFFLVHYIMYLARQNGKNLEMNDGKFSIKIDSARQYLELPTPDKVSNSKYKEKIQEPIESAIEEIEEAMRTNHDILKEYSFTIEPHYVEDGSIETWLEGTLEIEFQREFAERFIRIAKEQERHLHDREKAEAAANAKAAAKQKANA